MALGKKIFEFSAKDMIRGMSTSDDLPDGGFSPLTDAVNLTTTPGVLYAPAAPTDKSTNLTENMIATCEDPSYLGKDALYLDDAGAFYSFNGTTLTKEVTASSDLFTRGTTDMVPWYDANGGLNFYATTKAGANGDIVKWNKTSTLTETWWSGAGTLNQGALSSTTAWRPLLVYERQLFVGDRNNLHRISPDNPIIVANSIISLNANESISALGIDKGSGYMLIATTTGVDYSVSRNSKSKIYFYDGFSNKPLKEIPINGTVTAFKQTDDRTLVFIGNKVGYFTGSGVKFLRTNSFALGDANLAIYPHRAIVIENTVYFLDDKKIIAYGEINQGGKVFYPIFYNSPLGTPIRLDMISSIGGNKLGFGYASSKFFTLDTLSVATTNSQVMHTNFFDFDEEMILERVKIIWKNQVSNNVNPGSIQFYNENGAITMGSVTAFDLKNTSGASNAMKEILNINIKAVQIQVRMLLDTVNPGIVRIIGYGKRANE